MICKMLYMQNVTLHTQKVWWNFKFILQSSFFSKCLVNTWIIFAFLSNSWKDLKTILKTIKKFQKPNKIQLHKSGIIVYFCEEKGKILKALCFEGNEIFFYEPPIYDLENLFDLWSKINFWDSFYENKALLHYVLSKILIFYYLPKYNFSTTLSISKGRSLSSPLGGAFAFWL